MNQMNAMDTSAENNIVECILTDKEDVVVRICRTSSALRKEGERRYSTGQKQRPDNVNSSDIDITLSALRKEGERRYSTYQQQRPDSVDNGDMDIKHTDSFLEKKRSISFHEQVKVKITPRYEREDIPSLFYSCSDIKE